MFDLCTNFIVLIHDIIWINKTCGEYISRTEHSKYDSYIIQDEGKSDKWAHINIDPLNIEIVRINKIFKTNQYYTGEEYVLKTTRTFI